MANTTVVANAGVAGLTLTMKLYAKSALGTVINNGGSGDGTSSVGGGNYTAVIDEAATGLHMVNLETAGGAIVSTSWVNMVDTVTTLISGEMSVMDGTTNDLDELVTYGDANWATGSLSAANVWSYSSRTLTQSAASVTAAVSGSTITIHRGDSLSASLTGIGSVANRSKLWFTVKDNKHDADTQSIIQIDDATGLLYLNGSNDVTAANGAITVDDANDGDITITLQEADTATLNKSEGLYYDVQMLDTSGNVSTLTEGQCNINLDVTRSVT